MIATILLQKCKFASENQKYNEPFSYPSSSKEKYPS
jgi:hypothetical protein